MIFLFFIIPLFSVGQFVDSSKESYKAYFYEDGKIFRFGSFRFVQTENFSFRFMKTEKMTVSVRFGYFS